MSHDDEEVGVCSCEDRDVHRHAHRVGFVEADSEVALAAEKQQDEDSDVHEADAS